MISKLTIPPKDRAVWTDRERDAWRTPRKMPVSQWADENVILLAKTSAEPGPYRTARTPYIEEPLNCFGDTVTQIITCMFSTQVGKTVGVLLNSLGYFADQDPGPTILVYPTEDLARDISESRIMPMFRRSPALARHLTPRKYDFKTGKYNLDYMICYFAWANSAAALSSRPVRRVLFDELDKFPSKAGIEADPVELAIERTRTFWNRKIGEVSTPTTKYGAIYREWLRSDQRKYYLPCPHCGEYQVLMFGDGGEAGAGVKWPKNVSIDDIANKRLAWYECEHCRGRITDIHKPRMLAQGRWVPAGASIDKKGVITGDNPDARHKGFWINALYSPWLSFGEIAAKFLTSKDDVETLQNFVNSWLAEIWDNKVEGATEEELKRHVEGYQKGEVPPGVQVITAAVDVQKYCYYLTVRGWGYGEESWLIRADRVEGLVNTEDDWDLIYQELRRTYTRQDGGDPMPVRLAGVDSGYRPDEVYDFCNRFRDWIKPLKGASMTGPLFRASPVEHNPRTGKRYTGLVLYSVDVDIFKDKLARLIGTVAGDPAEWHLYNTPSDDYFRQMVAEEKVIETDKRGRPREIWQLTKKGRPNHFLDTEVYNLALAAMLAVPQLLKRDPVAAGEQKQPPMYKRPDEQGPPPRKSGNKWVGDRGRSRGRGGKWL